MNRVINMNVENCVLLFKANRKKEKYCRDKSYEICRGIFIKNLKYKNDSQKVDEMALHLFAYLANWGMLRNSFLLYKNYKCLIPIVKEIYNHSNLLNWEPTEKEDETTFDEIMTLRDSIRKSFYDDEKEYHKETVSYKLDGFEQKVFELELEEKEISVTDTLVSKIMLGTLGCVPAYDTYFVRALKAYNIPQSFNKDSLKTIISNSFSVWNDDCKKITNSIDDSDGLYTKMRIVDMYLWWTGFVLVGEEKSKKNPEIDKEK